VTSISVSLVEPRHDTCPRFIIQKQERLRREREWQEEQRLKEVEKAKRDEEAERRSRQLAGERYKQDMEAAAAEREKQVGSAEVLLCLTFGDCSREEGETGGQCGDSHRAGAGLHNQSPENYQLW
jgi:hypothetical protein